MKELLGKIQVALSEQGYPLQKDTYHFVTRVFQPTTRVERTFYSLLFQSAYQSEIMSAGSSYIALVFAMNFIEELLKKPELINDNEVALLSQFEELTNLYKEKVRMASIALSEEGLRAELDHISNDPILSKALQEALLVSGLEGKIHVEDGIQPNYVIEQKSGYSFQAMKPFKFMLPQNGVWEARDCKVMLVDGVLERVSELDKILNRSMETQLPLLLVAHGFSEEIAATLKMNMDAGKLNIMPLRLTPDLDSLNVINDIAVVCGGDIISTLKGQMVVFTDYDTLPQVEEVRLTQRELIIENAKTRGGVSQHLRMLLEKRQSQHQVEDIHVLLDKRIQTLIAAAVTIRLPNMTTTERDATKVKIDIALRSAKTLLNWGQVSMTKVLEGWAPSNAELEKAFITALVKTEEEMPKLKDWKRSKKEYVPTLSAFAGVYFVGKTVLSMMTTNGLVEIVTL